uniref:Multidrug and toxin extrusion protein n=1 Tax=Amphiprion ocellaris TaxID=80972 RepID=A0AAQ5XUT5_AMPOC
LNYLLPFVVTMFCGRLGNDVMAGYGLASASINVTTAATGYGLILACDTLVSQTFGGKNLLRVGVILQRGIIILLLFCLPCWGLLINAQVILLCVGQDPEVARTAQLYITAYIPAVPVSHFCFLGIILPQMYAAALANIANVLTNYTFLYWLDLGVRGSAAANALSQIYISTFLFAFIWWKKLHVTTWGGWSVESLQEWGSFMKLAIPSTLMKCFEWWVYELGGFFAGMLSEDELAAQHAVIMVAFITYMFPLGIQAAACARVGNALGAGDTARAILTTKVALTLAGSIAVVEGIVLGSTKTVIGFIFTSDEKIIGLVSHLMNAYSHNNDRFVSLHPQGVCTGIFLGTGKQKIPAVANFIGYYCIGLSLSITLMFVAKLRVFGFWLGLLICVILQSTLYIVVIFNLNWERMTEEVCYWILRLICACPVNLNYSLYLCHIIYQSKGDCDTVFQSVDGYMSVSVCDGSAEPQGGVQQLKGGRLSTTQLILRRGLTMFMAVSLLAVGATVRFLVPLPETPSVNFTADWMNSTKTPDHIFSTVLLPTEESE